MYVYAGLLLFMLQLRFVTYLINEYVMLCYVIAKCGGSVPYLIHGCLGLCEFAPSRTDTLAVQLLLDGAPVC